MAIEVFMDLLQPTLMATVVNDGILGGNMSLILQTSLSMLVIAVIGLVAGIACTVFAMYASQSFAADLRSDLFKKVSGFSFNEVDTFSTGSLVTRLTNDVTQLQNIVAMILRAFVRAPLLGIGGTIMILSLSITYGIVLAVVIPIITGIIFIILKKTTRIFTIIQKKLDKLNAILQENLSGVRVIKAFVRGAHEKSRFNVANEELKNANLSAMYIMAVIQPILMIIMNAVVIAVIYIGGLQVQAEAMRVGDIMAAIAYMTQILMSLMMMSRMFMLIPRAKASGDRVREVLETEQSIADGNIAEPIQQGSIVFEDVTFAYPGGSGEPVLKEITLDVKAGSHIGIIGATGAGKSALVGLIPRFYDVSEGRIKIDGIDVKDYTIDALRSRIGFVLQEPLLFSGTIDENIRWGNPDADRDEVKRAAAAAQADEFISAITDGYDSVLGQGGLTLSGGQKQRACIARALIKDPKILIMDDSTSALDLDTERKLGESIASTYTGKTRITIAQRIASIMRVDKLYVIDNGKIAACGTHEELLKSSDIYKDIYRSQIGQGVTA